LKFEKILVPVDFSPHSDKAVEAAVELAKAFGGEVHLIHAYSMPVAMVGPYDYQIPANILGDLRDSAARRVDQEAKKLADAGVKANALIAEGVPTQVIADAAEQIGADLIVMGTRGLTGLKHAVLGSVTERTIRHAPCPVLTVHDPDGDED
jgi:nucleotide-binding universal stress UspA family protein